MTLIRDKGTIVVFRIQLLPISETFIVTQAAAMRRFSPFFVGWRRTAGIELPEDTSWTVDGGGLAGRLRELRFRYAGPTRAQVARLRARAEWAAAGIDPNDRQRIVRALELADLGELEPPAGESQLWSEELRHPTLLAGLTMERESLYETIDARVDAMLAAGAREQVRRAHAAGASQTARKALGFEQLLAGDVEGMKRRTRNYAKRQLTWMRKLAGVRLVDVSAREPSAVAREILLDSAA